MALYDGVPAQRGMIGFGNRVGTVAAFFIAGHRWAEVYQRIYYRLLGCHDG